LKESEIRPQALFDRYLELSRKDIEHFFADSSGFVHVPCPACGTDSPEPGLEKHGFSYVLCSDCGSLYVSPRPTPERLDDYYRDAESVRYWSTHFYRETADARREKMFRPRAQLVAEYARGNSGARSGTFVDIGSGFAIFLEEVGALGRFERVCGIEPNPEMAEIGRERGFDVLEAPIEALEADAIQADFATSFEVLEHVSDPLVFLQASRKVLKPGGVLLLTTLTVSGFDIQVLWEHSKSVHPPHHLNLLSVDGMRRVVERAGFELAELTTPGQLDVDIVAGMLKSMPDLAVPRFVRELVERRDGDTRRAFQEFLAANRLSSHIRVLAYA
jgi:SAM-dependent methyltransferase